MINNRLKKYIFLTPSINDMGGAQMYIRNKVVYLKNKGWQVDVIYAHRGNIMISELQQFHHHVEEIGFSAFLYFSTKREYTVKKMMKMIRNTESDEIIIETTCVSQSSWGELLAQRLNCKHIVYILQEQTNLYNEDFINFLLFKHARKELVGITPTSLLQMFEPVAPISLVTSYSLPAYCTNVVEDYDHTLIEVIKQKKADYIIGSIGRIDKPFLYPNLIKLKKYMQEANNKCFILILMGDETGKNNTVKRRIIELYKSVPNVECIITGFMFPLPLRLIRLCDLFFASAGSARVSEREGVPTISIDSNDYYPIGVLGYTTNNSLFRDTEPRVSFEDLLEDILIDQKYTRKETNTIKKHPDFSTHLQFIWDSIQTCEYYDINSIKLNTFHEVILKLALSIIGPNLYVFLSKWKSTIFK